LQPTVKEILLNQILVAKHNARVYDKTKGVEDLAVNIKAVGLLQPITVYFNSEKEKYIILAGQRRFNAYQHLNKYYPDEGFDRIKCFVIPEPETNEEKLSMSLAENITQVQMRDSDLRMAVTSLFNTCRDYKIVKEKFGLSSYMINKYVRLARLSKRMLEVIDGGGISSDHRRAENAILRAVDALNWTSDGDVMEEDVLNLAREYAGGKVDPDALDAAAERGGSISDIIRTAKNRKSVKHTIVLSLDVDDKLEKIAKSNGESIDTQATNYVVMGVTKDYDELDD